MDVHTAIRIREKGFGENSFTVSLTVRDRDGDEQEATLTLQDPYDAKTDGLLEWYFERYIANPYDDVKVDAAVQAIRSYGQNLFEQIFAGDVHFHYRNALRQSGPEGLSVEVVGDSPGFQAIYWESLHDPQQPVSLAAQGVVFLRKNINLKAVKATADPSPTINLLIVTARPNEETDVDYRTVQRPLIELIEETETPVQPHVLRPGTYEALVKHLDEKAGHYHIIHFDLHGALLDYQTYQQVFENTGFQNISYKAAYGLKKLEEEAFQNGRKAFVFFESEEKGTAVPVDAEQLADLLEHKRIPVCILNACQSAKQDSSRQNTSLGLALLQKGIQHVLAMRYSVSVTAAKVLMAKLYKELYRQKPVEQAVAAGRKELSRVQERRAAYNREIRLEDWLLPILYQNGKQSLNLRKPTSDEEIAFIRQQQVPLEIRQDLTYGFFGRDLDILKIEKNILLRSNILLLQGMGGAGKTTLLRYLAAWWLRTGFIERAFYFGYDVKAYSLNEIIYAVAKELYSPLDYGTFTGLPADVQESRIVKALKVNRHALILDNTESITGEKLAIPNTLPPEERRALKNFLRQLRGGQTAVIIGSRAGEDWLKNGTFENNLYLLRGLDAESAANFANKILETIGVKTKAVVNDGHFQTLLKLLAGYPLALKAILPNLRTKTAKRIFEELKEGLPDLDSGNPQERTESIIKCIEYAHSNLSEEAQQLLLCLVPFQSIVNVTPDVIQLYFDELKKERLFQNFSFENFDKVVNEAVQNGFMQEAEHTASLRLMSLQPVFTFFLKNKLRLEKPALIEGLHTAFISYYKQISVSLSGLINSMEPKQQGVGLFLIGYEHENLYQTLSLLLERQQSVYAIFTVIDGWLESNKLQRERMDLGEKVQKAIEQYAAKNFSEEIRYELTAIKFKVGSVQDDLQDFVQARKTYEEILIFPPGDSALSKGYEFIIAQVYLNLGNLSAKEKDYVVAEGNYQKALRIYVKFNDEYSQAPVYQNLGNLSAEQKEYAAAKSSYQNALKIFAKFNDEYNQARIYNSLGNASREQKEYVIAEGNYQKALQIFEKFNDEYRQADVYLNLGSISINQENYVAAKGYCQKALETYVRFNDGHRQADVYQNLGNISMRQKEYPAAQGYYQKALGIFVKFNDEYSQAGVCYNSGVVSMEQEEYAVAEDNYQKALGIYIKFNDEYKQALVYQNLGVVSAEQKEYPAAKSYYQKALEIFVKFKENVHSITDMAKIIFGFAKENNDEPFAQKILEKAAQHAEGKTKEYLLGLLTQLNQP